MEFCNKKSCIVITGASRGIGRGIAVEFGRRTAPGSVFVLLARSADSLNEVKGLLASEAAHVRVEILIADLSKPEDYDFRAEIASLIKENGTVPSFQQVVIVHNAGSIGNISKRALGIDNVSESINYYKLNVVSPMILNTAFFRIFSDNQEVTRKVVNISSLCAIQPFKSFAMYCSGKAARNMFFKVLAAEEPDIKVLNYGPGPVDTEMVNDIIKNSWDKSLVEWNMDIKENQTILSPEETSKRLVMILDAQKYKSGDHVDYFDEL